MGQETLRGLPAWKAGMTGFFAAFPDAACTLHDIFFAGDRGVWRGAWHATQRGTWEGVAPTGKMVEDWVEYDRLGLYRQLGAIPLTSG